MGTGAGCQQTALRGWTRRLPERAARRDGALRPRGSGGGGEQFVAGCTDSADSDALLDEDELIAIGTAS